MFVTIFRDMKILGEKLLTVPVTRILKQLFEIKKMKKFNFYFFVVPQKGLILLRHQKEV